MDINDVPLWNPKLETHGRILIYGSSNSGKTVALNSILHANRKEIDYIFLFSSTAFVQRNYLKSIPKAFRFDNWDTTAVAAILDTKIWSINITSTWKKIRS